jgi:hypothetical protein
VGNQRGHLHDRNPAKTGNLEKDRERKKKEVDTLCSKSEYEYYSLFDRKYLFY